MSATNLSMTSPRRAAVLRRAHAAQCRQGHDGIADGTRHAASCRIRALMAARGLTATDVAAATGLKASSVQRWLYGRKAPSGDDLLAKLATVFAVDFGALLDSGEPCATQYVRAAEAVLAHA
ncbi:helix-turn-helix domain-containing protein [Amycolatopsis palatopharyngis]|uniref:helix-turn-helix domain-containing protein n=1 Tax=Amycolatopsis palatopharyngis TaxID=187982 RepID=UPI000E280606|nr:helix-turn-helix transcriptional regulator [Amycolatopsis palatopharyngis]